MKFFTLSTTLLAGLAIASPVADPKPEPEADVDVYVEKRIAPAVVGMAILTGVVSGLVGAAAREAISTIKDVRNWDDAREKFTTRTVELMVRKAHAKEAAVCVNVGYSVDDESKIRDRISLDYKMGNLHTDYDCFYLSGPSTFHLEGDGGFINIAVQSGPCKYDRGTLTCPP
ncbi:hypothetical protein CB0940_08187 [Cercospora beticola]|uniref:DUF7888 domain-containing protein n=1 Tax=Cercospora beticola TaxID=122368 RepID=A0A2G5HPX1_CERBT|nr:hypothetical protein CB0940_08187 [Cercospora beticola]PIA94303.1 hypothetical protein CB0940_08187 [Cercospora beticola]WPB04754.1 hypothetical protein RHO25_009401 [Cercospora beticola]CAK1364512.1 unnamed protein product [Cercospora beticola]